MKKQDLRGLTSPPGRLSRRECADRNFNYGCMRGQGPLSAPKRILEVPSVRRVRNRKDGESAEEIVEARPFCKKGLRTEPESESRNMRGERDRRKSMNKAS